MTMSMRTFLLGSVALVAVEAAENPFWGRCDPQNRDQHGCKITSGHKCSDHLSPGPKNATLEIVVGNLPPSTAERPVHVHYFAAREALGYDPVSPPPHWYTIYQNVKDAYPEFSDADFNGGNVKVNETGHAVLRLMAPSTYIVCKDYVRWPHMKLRLCTGEDYIVHRAEILEFGNNGIKVHACSNENSTELMKIESFSRTAHPIPPLPADEVSTSDKATTTKVSTSDKATTTKFMSTTTALETSTTIARQSQDEADSIADDSFDWEALEFSPVYQCLTDNQVYNHFTSKCAEKCPPDTDLKHGQCVRQNTMEVDAEFDMSWDLKVNCDEKCWEAKKSRSLHDLRLAVADHLDIPFQEVLKVVLRSAAETGRRLSHHHTDASLYISVTTGRIEAGKGEQLLRTFFTDKTSASQLLGLTVHSLAIAEEKAAAPAADQLDPKEASDEFAQFYKDSEPEDVSGFSTITGSPADVFPAGVVIGIAAGVVVLGLLTALGLWYKKRLSLRNPQQSGEKNMKGEKVGAPEKQAPEENNKVVEA